MPRFINAAPVPTSTTFMPMPVCGTGVVGERKREKGQAFFQKWNGNYEQHLEVVNFFN